MRGAHGKDQARYNAVQERPMSIPRLPAAASRPPGLPHYLFSSLLPGSDEVEQVDRLVAALAEQEAPRKRVRTERMHATLFSLAGMLRCPRRRRMGPSVRCSWAACRVFAPVRSARTRTCRGRRRVCRRSRSTSRSTAPRSRCPNWPCIPCVGRCAALRCCTTCAVHPGRTNAWASGPCGRNLLSKMELLALVWKALEPDLV